MEKMNFIDELQCFIEKEMDKIVKSTEIPARDRLNEFSIFLNVYKFLDRYDENIHVLKENSNYIQPEEKEPEIEKIINKISNWADIRKKERNNMELIEETDIIWDTCKFLKNQKISTKILNNYNYGKKFNQSDSKNVPR